MIKVTQAYGLSFAYPGNDTVVGPCLERFGEFARVGATFAAELAAGATLVDVGANIGAVALFAARQARQVVAIEAHPGLADLLVRNVAENGVGNVQVLKAAASAQTGLAAFPAPPLSDRVNFGMSGFGHAGPLVRVPTIALDELDRSDVRVVKVDVEGHELDVLAGAPRLLTETRPHWIVETDPQNSSAREVIELLLHHGYRVFWLYDPFVTPMAPKAAWTAKLRGDLNVLAVPPGLAPPEGMVEVLPGFAWPASTAGFRYLRRFRLREYGSSE